jgi:hypothetical protein
MSYDRSSWYITWGGRLGDSEIWQTGLHAALDGTGVSPPAPDDDAVEAVKELVEDFHANELSHISNEVKLDWVKIAKRDTAGADTDAPAIWEFTTAPLGLSATHMPFSSAAVVSLRSGSTFGRANFGRMYLPCVASEINPLTNGRFDSTTTSNLAGTAGALIDGINSHLSGFWSGGIAGFNVRNLSKVGSGTAKKVTSVYVGNVPDTQRRRRNALAEVYATQAID